jgi:serine protease AprX
VWRKGIVVVAAAGNSGPKDGTINKPADDPMVISVGAYDDRLDTLLANDRVADWSSRGPTVDGIAKPDVVAPGRTLVSTVDPRSLVAQQNADSLVAPGYIVGSGSSQAAAVTSGAAALLLSQRPSLTPDQVKAALRSTAVKIGDTPGTAQGRGRVAVDAALQAPPSSSVQTGKATGLGSLELSRGGVHMQTTCPGSTEPRAITGEIDALCRPWNGVTWTGVTWTGVTWTGVTWTGDTWTADTWTADTWTGDSWTGDTWTGVTWTGDTWTGDTWTGDTWTGDSWMSAFWGDKTPSWRPLPGEKAKAKDTRGSR